MSGFRHDIAGGQGNLIATSMQSPNFVHNSAGWQIRKDGSVEFNNGTFRGTVTAGTFEGTDFIINSSGAFFYSGAPATGNLIASIASTGGTDSFGNVYKEGYTIYSGAADIQLHVNGVYPAPAIELPSGVSSEFAHPAIYNVVGNSGAVNEFENLVIQGPASTFDHNAVSLVLIDTPKDGTGEAAGVAKANSTEVFYWDAGGIHSLQNLYGDDTNHAINVADRVAYSRNSSATTPFSGALHLSKTLQNSSASVTGNTFTKLSNIWSLPQNDPAQETQYRLTTRGTITTPGSGGPSFNVRVNAFNATSSSANLGGAAYTAGNSLDFEIVTDVMVVNPGATAFLYFTVKATFTTNGTNATGLSAGQNSIVIVQNSTASGVDTTIGSPNITIQAEWSSSNAGQGTSQTFDTLERFGGA